MPYNTELLFFKNSESRSHEDKENSNVRRKKSERHKKKILKKYFHFGDTSEEPSQIINTQTEPKSISSAPEFRKQFKVIKINTSSSLTTQKAKAYNSKYVVNHVSNNRVVGNSNPFDRVRQPTKWRVYRCRLGPQEESCCCSCNFDAMFEVMISLYDCYKKTNCDHGNCFLSDNLPREERKAGEARKSAMSVGAETASMRSDKMLEGNSPAEPEKILKQMAREGEPLSEGKSRSEIELIKKMNNNVVLASGPLTPEEKTKLRRTELSRKVVPLEGKSTAEKKKILKKQTALGLHFHLGRRVSEKSLVDKTGSEIQPKAFAIPSQKILVSFVPPIIFPEKLKKAKTEGLLTPLRGKTPEQQEKILQGLTKHGIPLPEPITSSERQIVDKIRKKLGLPPEPKSVSIRDKYNKAQVLEIITHLEGKKPAQKEKILRGLAQTGAPLPGGRKASEKALINKVKAETGYKIPARAAVPSKFPLRILSEKVREAKALGLLTPLARKTSEQKKEILKGLAKLGVSLTEGKTRSIKKIIDKVRRELSPEQKSSSMRYKNNKARVQGIIVTLEEKTPAEKEKIIKGLAKAGLPLPEGRTASEKALINKVKAKSVYKNPSDFSSGVASEKLRKAKALLLTPFEGKSPEQKKTILRGLTMHRQTFPPFQSDSDTKIAAKVRTDLGMPPEPKDAAERDKYNQAMAHGVIISLEGKSLAEKEKKIRHLHDRGIELPTGRTPSEKALISKIKAEVPCDYGITHEVVVSSEKKTLTKVKARGLLTPLTGKTPDQKEKILRCLAEAGLPLPEGKTASEKTLIKKVHAAFGQPLEPTSLERLEKKRGKKIEAKKHSAAIKAAGIEQEFEDIHKTTKCDRGCACEKKKIKFKHSYVKIRVTSPDISSLCRCREECIPRVKGGVFVDNEGIKVTVESALGVPSPCIQHIDHSSNKEVKLESSKNGSSENSNLTIKFNSSSNSAYGKQNYTDGNTYASEIEKDSSTDYILDNYLQDKNYNYTSHDSEMIKRKNISKNVESAILSSISSAFFERYISDAKTTSNSNVLLRTESSLSFSTNFTSSIKTISLISLHNSSIISTSSHYICYPKSVSASSLDENDSEYFTNEVDYTTVDVQTSESDEIKNLFTYTSNTSYRPKRYKPLRIYNKNVFSYGISQQDVDNAIKRPSENKHKSIIIINELNRNSCDYYKFVEEVMTKQNLSKTSSIFIVVPTTESESDDYDNDNDNGVTNTASSTICIRLPQTFFSSDSKLIENTVQYQTPITKGIQYLRKTKNKLTNTTSNAPITSCSKDDNCKKTEQMTNTVKIENAHSRSKVNKKCQMKTKPVRINSFGMDTSRDRPCCCRKPKLINSNAQRPSHHGVSDDKCVANVLSELMTPMIVSQGLINHVETYQSRPNLNLHCQTSVPFSKLGTSISSLKVNPCAGNTHNNEKKIQTQNLYGSKTQSQNLYGSKTQTQILYGRNTKGKIIYGRNQEAQITPTVYVRQSRESQRQRIVTGNFVQKYYSINTNQSTPSLKVLPPCECVQKYMDRKDCNLQSHNKPPLRNVYVPDKKRVGFIPLLRLSPNSSCDTCMNKKVIIREDFKCKSVRPENTSVGAQSAGLAQRTLYKYRDPTQRTLYEYRDPTQRTLYEYKDPTQRALYEYRDPTQRTLYEYRDPTQRRPYEYKDPTERTPCECENPTKRTPCEYKDQTQRTPCKCENPTKRTPCEYKDQTQRTPCECQNPTQRTPCECENPTQRTPCGYENPTQKTPYEYKDLTQRTPCECENPTQRTPCEYKDPTQRTPCEFEDPTQRTPCGYEDPTQKTPYGCKDPTPRTPYEYKDPAQRTPYEYKDPTQRTPCEFEDPAKRTPCEFKDPVERKPYEYKDPKQRTPYEYKDPTQRTPCEFEDPAERIPCEFKDPVGQTPCEFKDPAEGPPCEYKDPTQRTPYENKDPTEQGVRPCNCKDPTQRTQCECEDPKKRTKCECKDPKQRTKCACEDPKKRIKCECKDPKKLKQYAGTQSEDPTQYARTQSRFPAQRTQYAGTQPEDPTQITQHAGTQSEDPTQRTQNAAKTKITQYAGAQFEDPTQITQQAGTQSEDPTQRIQNAAKTKITQFAGAQPEDPTQITQHAGTQSEDPTQRTQNAGKTQTTQYAGTQPEDPTQITQHAGTQSEDPTQRIQYAEKTQTTQYAGAQPEDPTQITQYAGNTQRTQSAEQMKTISADTIQRAQEKTQRVQAAEKTQQTQAKGRTQTVQAAEKIQGVQAAEKTQGVQAVEKTQAAETPSEHSYLSIDDGIEKKLSKESKIECECVSKKTKGKVKCKCEPSEEDIELYSEENYSREEGPKKARESQIESTLSSNVSSEEALKYHEEHHSREEGPKKARESQIESTLSSNVSSEEALKYHEEHPRYRREEYIPIDENLNGLKLSISGKRTRPKGLKGLSCFDHIVQESNPLISR